MDTQVYSKMRSLRHQRGLRLEDVARRTGYTAPYLSMLERLQRRLEGMDAVLTLLETPRLADFKAVDVDMSRYAISDLTESA
jgi:transcriptional regulator with XRE-family HTH domain